MAAEKKKTTAKKTPKKKTAKRKRKRVRVRGRYANMSPAERVWVVWAHDFDTLLHELIKNPRIAGLTPEQVIVTCEQVADAYHAMQARRRPAGVEGWR